MNQTTVGSVLPEVRLPFVRKSLPLICLASAFFGITSVAAATTPLPKLNLASDLTVSGLSSGGYMAAQFHVAFSNQVQGAAIIAAGPVYCAQNSLAVAFGKCLNQAGSQPDLAAAATYLKAQQQAGAIDNLNNLKDDKVWLFHGTADVTVASSVSDALTAQYQTWVAPNNLRYVNDQKFAHHFPTNSTSGNDCLTSEAPFLGNCQYDAAGLMLAHLLPKLAPKAVAASGTLHLINQFEMAAAAKGQLAETGYLYVPQSCSKGQKCQLHVSFHGCKQYAGAVGDAYARGTGLNEYADTNRLVVLYPQTEKSSVAPLNPSGCWDWWGYSGENYATKKGPQMAAVKQLIDALSK
jgi:poly(3-hydroxybutyrate) depolymerase